ncbi:CAAX amino terminal protease self- immunity [Rubripirellula tenax]|uniref:CAAX amino terminal protease self-immunity n=1 Tax=Rubripirellula tenax TaxID=2528015 RepID=A0A5C6F3K6_9BACT|nr:type II CAAX endopeptidase family protein [Rubripirellula tenax]TWU56383.1 CAAX amino terminal protease self- immunity [Rubripirellula tenax]
MDDTEAGDQSPDDVFLTAVLFESALGVLAILLGLWLGPDPRAWVPEIDLSVFAIPVDWEALIPIGTGVGYGALAAIPMLVAIDLLRRLPWEPVRELERLSDDGLIKSLLQLRASEMIVISLCAGIGEELLFRGWLMYWLADGWKLADEASVAVSPEFALGAGLVGSSIAFGLVHPLTKLYVVVATVMGFYFGGLLIWSENMLVPITAHATYDAVQLMLSSRSLKKEALAG